MTISITEMVEPKSKEHSAIYEYIKRKHNGAQSYLGTVNTSFEAEDDHEDFYVRDEPVTMGEAVAFRYGLYPIDTDGNTAYIITYSHRWFPY